MEPRVVLSAGNIAHYHHTALALQKAGLLARYLCTFDGTEASTWWGKPLPADLRKRLQGKTLSTLDSHLTKTFPFPYLVTQILRRARIINTCQANEWFSAWHGYLTTPYVSDGEIFHFVSSLGFCSARQAKKHHKKLICDVRTPHISHEDDSVCTEYRLLGLNYQPIRTPKTTARILEEYNLADEIFVMSTYAKETFLQEGFAPEQIHVVPLGVNTHRFGKRHDVNAMNTRDSGDNIFRVLYVGQIIPRKGLHYLLGAFRKINLPESKLLLLGAINDIEYARRYIPGDEPRIRHLGHVPQSELQQIYQMADVFVLPSISDGFAMVVSEAMIAGLPVIVSENVGARDLVRDGIDGFVVPIRDVEALAEKLVWLYEHPGARRAMGASAAQRVQDFTWECYGERLVEVYRKILG